VPALGNFTDEQEQRNNSPGMTQDTREYPLQSNDYQHNHNKNKMNGGASGGAGGASNGGAIDATSSNSNNNYNNGPERKSG